jgi:hypothetical protein
VDKIEIEIRDNFQSSLNPHDEHVQAWTCQLDALHPVKLRHEQATALQKAESDSMANAFDYWLLRDELDSKPSQPASNDAPAQTAATPAPVVTVEPAGDGIERRREKKPTIEAVALDYMREVYRAGQFQSAAKFHKHLTQTAEATGSPFEMGTGNNARKLFCPAASSFFDSGTLGKMWAKIRAV